MTREEFMRGQEYRMPPAGKEHICAGHHDWSLAHCELDDWDI